MGDFLKEDAAHIHFMDLKPKHVSEPALRRSFMTQPEVQIAAIREVYEDGLGELMRQHAELGNKIAEQENKIDAQRRTGRPARALSRSASNCGSWSNGGGSGASDQRGEAACRPFRVV